MSVRTGILREESGNQEAKQQSSGATLWWEFDI